MAVANYESTYGSLPPAYVKGPDGTPWHSWRVLILPFLECSEVYNAYRFDEPWNGPNNRKLADKVGSTFHRSGLDPATNRTTSFVAVIGPGTAWPGANALKFADIGDGLDKTLMVVEIPDESTPWMAPIDLDFDRMSFRINDGSGKGLGSRLGGARVVTVNDMVRTLQETLPPERLRALLTANGGEPVDWDALYNPIQGDRNAGSRRQP